MQQNPDLLSPAAHCLIVCLGEPNKDLVGLICSNGLATAVIWQPIPGLQSALTTQLPADSRFISPVNRF